MSEPGNTLSICRLDGKLINPIFGDESLDGELSLGGNGRMCAHEAVQSCALPFNIESRINCLGHHGHDPVRTKGGREGICTNRCRKYCCDQSVSVWKVPDGAGQPELI